MASTTANQTFKSVSFPHTKETFEKLWKRTRTKAMRMALRLTRDYAKAEDLCQTAYLSAWSAFESYRPDKPFFNWLTRIMKNAFFDEYRLRNHMRCPMSVEDIARREDESVGEIPVADEQLDPCTIMMIEEEWQETLRILEKLPEHHKRLVILRDVDGLSYDDIAEELNITRGAVRSRLHRARKELRSIVETGDMALPAPRPEWNGRGLKAIGSARSR